MSENTREAALRARAAANEAEAEAARASAFRLAGEVRIARAEASIARARLDAVARKARTALGYCRDPRAALALGDIAVVAEGGERAISNLSRRVPA